MPDRCPSRPMLRTQPQSVSGAFHSSIIFAARESLSARFLLRGLYKQMQKSALATAASLRSMTSHGVSRSESDTTAKSWASGAPSTADPL
mgnify:FL=1